MYFFRIGNEPIINLSVHQYYFSEAKVFNAQKSFVENSTKNDPGALFVEKPDFRVFLPRDLGLKCAFQERERSQ